jgi:hypothetical protein
MKAITEREPVRTMHRTLPETRESPYSWRFFYGGYAGRPWNDLSRADYTFPGADRQPLRNRINGSPYSRNQIPVGTILVYKTSAGHLGKLEIVKWGSRLHMPDYDLYVKFVTYRRDGSILTRRDNFRIKGTWVYALDSGKAISTLKNRAADQFWSIGSPSQAYVEFQNGTSFTIVS